MPNLFAIGKKYGKSREMGPNYSDIVYFLEVSGTENISRAAERLGITQPSLSLAIQRLEGVLGSPLLVRSKSGVKLTSTGRRFVNQGRALVQEWDKIKSEAVKAESEISGQYTIGCHPSVALYSVPFFVEAMLEEFPKLELKFSHDLSRNLTEEVISFKTDFAIVVNPVRHPDLVIRPLCKDLVTFWTRRNPSNLQNIKSNNAVLICDPSLLQTQDILKKTSRKGVKFDRIVTSPNLEVVTSLVASGAGVGILPTRVATAQKSLGLKRLTEKLPSFEDRISLIYRVDAQNTEAGKNLARFIESRLTRAFA